MHQTVSEGAHLHDHDQRLPITSYADDVFANRGWFRKLIIS